MKAPKIKKKYATGGFVAPEEQRAWILTNRPELVSAYDSLATGDQRLNFYNQLNTTTSVLDAQKAEIKAGIPQSVGNDQVIAEQEQNALVGKSALASAQTVQSIAGALGKTNYSVSANRPLNAAGPAMENGNFVSNTGGGRNKAAKVAGGIGNAVAFYQLGSTVGNAMKTQDSYGVNKSELSESIGSTLHPQDDILHTIKNVGKQSLLDTVLGVTPFAAGVHRNEQNIKKRRKIQQQDEQNIKEATALVGAQQGSNIANYGFSEGGEIKGPGTAKSDSIKNKKLAPGSFVVPAENADVAQVLRAAMLGKSTKTAKIPSGGDIQLSNGEHVFTPEEALVLKSKGINLNALAPNADDAKNLAAGGTPSGNSNAFNMDQFVEDLLVKLNIPVTSVNKNSIKIWAKAEGNTVGNGYNPLNTTLDHGTTTIRKNKNGSSNSAGVKDYSSYEEGLDATVKTLKLPYYKNLIDTLKKAKTEKEILDQVATSRWGTQKSSIDNALKSTKIPLENQPISVPKQSTKSVDKNEDPQLALHKWWLKKQGADDRQIQSYEDNLKNHWKKWRINGESQKDTWKRMLEHAVNGIKNPDSNEQVLLPKVGPNISSTAEMDPSIPEEWTTKGKKKITDSVNAPIYDYALPKQKNSGPLDMSGKRTTYPSLENPEHSTENIPLANKTGPGTTADASVPVKYPFNSATGKFETPADEVSPVAIKTPDQALITPAAPTETAGMKVMNALGGAQGLIALAQTGFGLAESMEKRPKGVVSSQLTEGKADAIKTQQEADAESRYGLSPEALSQVKGEIATNRNTDYANIDASTGNDAASYGLKRVASLNAGRNLVDLAVQDAQVKQQKKQYATSLKAPIDQYRRDIAGEQRNLFLDKLTGFQQRQQGSGAMINAGLKNYIDAQQAIQDAEELKRLKTTYPGLV